jgi:hypothetical protein
MHRCFTLAALLSMLLLNHVVRAQSSAVSPAAPEPILPTVLVWPGAFEVPTFGATAPTNLAPSVPRHAPPSPFYPAYEERFNLPLAQPLPVTAAPILLGAFPGPVGVPTAQQSPPFPLPPSPALQQQSIAPVPILAKEIPITQVSDRERDLLLSPKKPGTGIFATVDYLYWQLRRRDLDYGISSQPGALVFSNAEIHELEHPSDPGVRTMMGYQLATGWQIGFGYMYFDSTSTGSAEDGAGTLFATRSHPDINRRAGIADADSSFDMRVLDLEVRHSIDLGDRAELSLFGSFRWADINQAFQVFYDEIEFPIGGTVTSLLDTQAFGVRIGADGKWALTPHLYLVGTAETSILFSDNALSLTETEGATTILDLADGYEQALPVLGTRVGAGYDGQFLSIEAGYEMQAWFDLGDRLSFLDDQHLGVFAHSNHNVLMDGFYLRVGWKR